MHAAPSADTHCATRRTLAMTCPPDIRFEPMNTAAVLLMVGLAAGCGSESDPNDDDSKRDASPGDAASAPNDAGSSPSDADTGQDAAVDSGLASDGGIQPGGA